MQQQRPPAFSSPCSSARVTYVRHLAGSLALCVACVWAFVVPSGWAFDASGDRPAYRWGAAPPSDPDRSVAPPDTDDVPIARPDTGDIGDIAPARPDTSRRDAAGPDSLAADALASDSLTARPDTGRTARYLPNRRRRTGRLYPERRSPFLGPKSPTARRTVALDTSQAGYRVTSDAGAMQVDATTVRRERYASNLADNWATLARRRDAQRRDRGGLGVNIVVPGGRQSAFSTIFGKPQVDLRVNGQADINAGFDYRKSEAGISLDGDAGQLDPDFKQDLRLGITGTIGDKMQIDVDWDTNNQFDYQNQVKLKYTGYEDEIIQSIEAGNVSLQTPSQLVSGGQSLFGLKGQFQFGNLNLTTIASQQEGQSKSLSIEGGSETTTFNLQPTDYDEDTHFFLGYFFRNNWNRAHSNPTTLLAPIDRVPSLEVWKLRVQQGANEPNVRRAVALVDLGEDATIVSQGAAFRDPNRLPNGGADQYTEDDLNALRDGNVTPSEYLRSNVDTPLDDQDFVEGEFKRLDAGRDYVIDEQLGYISLQQRLRANEALAVAYRYRDNNNVTREIGDIASENTSGTGGGVNGDRLILKLLRPDDPVAPSQGSTLPAAWFLELRNIYRLGGRGFTPDNFELDVTYEPPGETPRNTISEVSGSATLLETLGLDRLDQDGSPNADQRIDFSPLVIDAEKGLLIFPFLEPFGERILSAAEENSSAAQGEDFAFNDLYTKKKANAEKENTGNNVYRIQGEYKGATKEFYDLGAFAGVVEGSVTVTAGGQELQEGTDFAVDYQGGTVTITNPTYLAAGRDINIEYEQNSFANLQQKTLLGARANWAMNDRYALGGTVLRLSERSPVDKYRVGEEPIQNVMWGVDGSMDLEPRWLTQAVDALPLVQTKARSRVSVSGEFAQLRPGHSETQAFEDAVEAVRNSDDDTFSSDELNGTSFLDDFEGFENTFSLRQQLSAWRVSAPPAAINDATGTLTDVPDQPGFEDDLERSYWRGTFAWYQLGDNILDQIEDRSAEQRGAAGAIDPIRTQELFPERDVANDLNQVLRTLDLYFSPWERGPYNYTPALDEFVATPKKVWGGFTQRLPQGYTDFSLQNVEFVEMIVKVFPEPRGGESGDQATVTPGAKLYLELGNISEDILPDGVVNNEDGLASDFSESDLDNLSRLATGQQNSVLDIRNGRTEDLGLDGLVSYTGTASGYDPALLETNFYSDFIADARAARDNPGVSLSADERRRLEAEVAKIELDPSGDDYFYFEDDNFFGDETFFPGGGATVQQRFTRYFSADELDGIESQSELAEFATISRGLSRRPDTEDLNGVGGSVETLNDYYQYAVPLDSLQALSVPSETDDYIISELNTENDEGLPGWYKVRIPVRDFTSKIGQIEDFTRIRALRLWTTGHEAPVTLRLASMELVGSQWRTSGSVRVEDSLRVANDADGGMPPNPGEGVLRVASINNEEDSEYERPVGAIVSRNRTAQGATQLAREQSLLLNVDSLSAGQQRGVFKSYQGLDLLKYSNLRMYTHAEGPNPDDIDENLRLFVRLGTNEADDYYEYEQPLVTSRGGYEWPQDGEVNLRLSDLNQLKVARDRSRFQEDEVFTTNDTEAINPGRVTLSIRGRPSLNAVNTIVIGLRHVGTDATVVIEDAEVWVNELRVTGYDERSGWAALTNVDLDFADFVGVQGSFQQRTDGFGSLASTLDQREQADSRSWSVRSDVSVDKLLPERQGWQIPVTLQVQQERRNPRFDPNRGDVRVEEVARQFEEEGGSRREFLVDSVRTAAERFSRRRSMTASLAKDGSASWLLRNTADATALDFTYFDRTARSPKTAFEEQWNWSSSMEYRVGFERPRTVKPLWFLDAVPLLGALGDTEFNYVPQSVTFNANFQRDFTQNQNRSLALRPGEAALPNELANPLREEQQFTHRRGFSMQYNPFGFLNLTFGTNTQQSLNDVGATEEVAVRVFGEQVFSVEVEPDSTRRDTVTFDDRIPGVTLEEVLADRDLLDRLSQTEPENVDRLKNPDVVPDATLRTLLFEQEDLTLRGEGEVFRDLVFGDASPRTNTYQQRASATLRPGFTDGEALNWIDLQDVVYRANFDWRNGPEGSVNGANVANRVELRSGVNLRPNKVWERFGFYQSLQEAEQKEQAEKRAEEQRRRQERERRSQEEAERREQERYEELEERQRQQRGGRGDENAGTAENEDTSEGEAEDNPGDDPEREDRSEEEEQDPDEASDDGPSLPLPDLTGFFRTVALTFLDVRDVSITFTGGRSASSSNVGLPQFADDGTLEDVKVDYSLLDALGGRGPSLGYRLGLSRSVDPRSQRLFDNALQLRDQLDNSNRLESRTTLTPTQTLSISLNWDVEWNSSRTVTFRRITEGSDTTATQVTDTGVPFRSFEDQTGGSTASVWAFGSYQNVFEQQLATLQALIAEPPEDLTAGDIPLTNTSLADDFRAGFLTGLGTVGSRSFVPFPMPGWRISYTGLSDVPLLRSVTRSISIEHGYNATYEADYATVANTETQPSVGIGGQAFPYTRPEFEVTNAKVVERFSPLLGVNLSWVGNVETSVSWNRERNTFLRTASLIVEERSRSEVTASLRYSKRGLNIPLLPIGRLNNRITLELSVSRSFDTEREFNLRTALEQAGADPDFDPARALEGDNVSVQRDVGRFRVSPRLGYQFSNRVTADFLVEYERFEGDNREPSFTAVNGGFNIRISISEN